MITISRETMLNAVKRVDTVIDHGSLLPILQCLRMSVAGDKMVLTGTDLEQQISVDVPVLTADTEFYGCIESALLRRIIENSRDETITLRPETNEIEITSGRHKLTIGVLPPDDYPTLDMPANLMLDTIRFALPASSIRDAIMAVVHAAGVNDIRPYLNGVTFDQLDDTLSVVGCDGHQLALVEIHCQTGAYRCTVPRNAVQNLARMLEKTETASIDITNSIILVVAGNVTWASKIVWSSFIWRNLLKHSGSKPITVDRDQLIETVRLVAASAPEIDKNRPSTTVLDMKDGTLAVYGHQGNKRHYTGRIECNDDVPANWPTSIIVNTRYFLEFLSSTRKEEAEIQLSLAADNTRLDMVTHGMVGLIMGIRQ